MCIRDSVWIAPPEKQRAGIDLHVSRRVRIAPESVDPTVKNYHWLDLVQALRDRPGKPGADRLAVDLRDRQHAAPGRAEEDLVGIGEPVGRQRADPQRNRERIA